jgi:hypothetical protein
LLCPAAPLKGTSEKHTTTAQKRNAFTILVGVLSILSLCLSTLIAALEHRLLVKAVIIMLPPLAGLITSGSYVSGFVFKRNESDFKNP